ncbi:MAG: FMN-binding glutamate synthase family protein [Chitinophagales bacterium]|nr:FMN-binding glutamate synthase family protein [Chitinophagales bacterium]
MRKAFIIFSIVSSLIIIGVGIFWKPFFWAFIIFGPLIIWGIIDMFQKNRAIVRNFPILGRFRYIMEELRPKIYQYFIESDTNGTPVNRLSRSLVYQRAKEAIDTIPFGTQLNVYEQGYEWMNHSIMPIHVDEIAKDLRVTVGNESCKQPYSASILNVSAMSFGSLSANAVLALNGGAKIDNFAHNTGEGGISPYHLEPGGDLIWQIGTGYFGCRTKEGNFSEELFKEKANLPNIKMIEIKLSQGAKPGHGGILPAKKVTEEIAKIRHVEAGKTVFSPPYHTAFSNYKGLVHFIQKLRDLSNGKPIGFKLCIGSKSEFHELCKAMIAENIYPDYISIDGGEGGTGAAPIEFSNNVGMPYKDGLAFAYNCLIGYDIKKHIKLFSAGKITSAFDIFKTIALGADVCYSARAMMLSLGCIQALECNQNTCPTGVATQNKELMNGLNVVDKKTRVAQYHHNTVEALRELLAAAGLKSTSEITRKHVYMRLSETVNKRYEDLYGRVKVGEYLYGVDAEDYGN